MTGQTQKRRRVFVGAIVVGCSQAPFTLELGALGSFGGRRGVRVIWAGVSGDIKAELLNLEQDKQLGVTGSATLVRWLLQEGLIDELHLLVHPVAVGAGKRLFEPGEKIQLRLIDSTAFSTVVLHLVYGPAT